MSRAALFAYAVAVAAVVVDQLSKYWVVHVLRLPEGVSAPVLPFFQLTGVMNRGMSYGLLQHGEVSARALMVFRAIVATVIVILGRRVERGWTAGALGLIIGGALGNTLDGVLSGQVIDFLDFTRLHFPWVFNVADSCITVGVVLLILDGLLAPKSEERASLPLQNGAEES